MKTKRTLILIIAIIACAVLLTGCKKSNFALRINEDNTAVIEAVRASEGSFGGAGSLEVAEGQKLVIESKLGKKGEISLKFIGEAIPGPDAEAKQLIETVTSEEAVLEVTLKGDETAEYEIAPGVYFLSGKVLSKANGTVQISVR